MTDPDEKRQHTKDDISRLEFMRVSALAAGGAVMGLCDRSPLEVADPGTDDWTDPVVVDPTAWVSAVTGTDLTAMTREVLTPLGGIEAVVHEGESVFIKPNMVSLPWAEQRSPFLIGECTKPEIVVAVAEECLRAGASEVIGARISDLRVSWTPALLQNQLGAARAACPSQPSVQIPIYG